MVILNRIIQGLSGLLFIELLIVSALFIQKEPKRNQESVSDQVLAAKLEHKVSVQKPAVVSTPIGLENPFKVVAPKTTEDIVSLTTTKVKPILYANTVPLSPLSIQEKKRRFIDMMLPSILLAKFRLKLERKKVWRLSQKSKLTYEEKQWLADKQQEYKVATTQELYDKMAPHPTSLIIAQAIVESGWGTSKFFQKGNNVFGIWSFDRNDARIVASEKRGTKHVYLKKYQTIDQSIHDYLLTLSTVSHYKSFCEKRLKTQNPFTLVEHLEKYSELGQEYIANIKNIMRKNRLLDYDHYQLDL